MTEAVIELGGLIGYSGIGEAFEEEGVVRRPKKRLKTPTRTMDWAAAVAMLREELGASMQDISDATGISLSKLNEMINEKGFKGGDQGLALLALVTMNLGRDRVPLVGDYQACLDEEKAA
jgi:mevalonate kinase